MHKKIFLAILPLFLMMSCTSKYRQLYNKKPAFYSYTSCNLYNDNIIERYNSDIYATPASCQKVVTTLVALKALGPEYRYSTEMFVTKDKGNINDIIITFSGDPTLTTYRLIELLKPLKNTKIRGNIILDASIFKTSPYSHNLMIDDIGTSYATPVSALNIDQNLIKIQVTPANNNGLAIVTPDSDYNIQSNVTTSSNKTAVRLNWLDNTLYAKGNINVDNAPLSLQISPQNHDQYILNKMRSALSSLGIKVSANGRVKIIKNKAELGNKQRQYVNKTESETLEEIMKQALKVSDNLVFDSIYLSIIHSCSDKEISDWEDGHNVLKTLIKQYFGVDIRLALLIDGSGLSRYNRIQPITILSLLKKGVNVPGFVDLLPAAGEAGSTLKNYSLPRNIRAKTGSMSGITCLCGYNFDSKHPQAFIFMSNSFSPPIREMFEITSSFISRELR